jgi:flagellar biosynthesis/type III secretory pathway M-ring protein FliF/YscJ
MPFNAGSTAVNPEAGQDTNKRQFLLQAVRYGSAIAAAIVFVIFAGLGLRRLSRASAAGAPAAGVPSLLQAEMISLGGGNGNGHLRNRVKELIAKDPATAARLLQRWVNEDDAKKGKRNG